MNFMPPPLRCLSIFGLSLALAACDTAPTVVDQHFGLAVQRAQAQQSLLAPGAQHPVLWRCPPERPSAPCKPERQRDGLGQGMPPGMGLGPGLSLGPGPGPGRGTWAGPRSGPAAQDRLRTTPETDGASALSAVTRYQQSFQTPAAPAPVFNIGLGATSAP